MSFALKLNYAFLTINPFFGDYILNKADSTW
jgi:hypothetical protein